MNKFLGITFLCEKERREIKIPASRLVYKITYKNIGSVTRTILNIEFICDCLDKHIIEIVLDSGLGKLNESLPVSTVYVHKNVDEF